MRCERAIGTSSLFLVAPGPFFDRGRFRRVAHTLRLIPIDVKALPGGAWRVWGARYRTRSAAASPGSRTTLDRCQNRNRPAGANMSSMTMSGQLPDPRLRKVYCLEVTQLDWLNEGVFISIGAPGRRRDLRDLHRRMIPPPKHEEKVVIVTGASQTVV